MTSVQLLTQMAQLAIAKQTVLITGGTGGIGLATARLFKLADCNVIITGTNQDKLERAVQELPASNSRAWGFACDIRDPAAVDAMIRKAAADCPPIDILINNAGFALSATAPFWEQDMTTVDSVMDVNLRGLMHVTHAVLKHHMMQRKPQPVGTIVNISSITGHQAPLRDFFEASYHTSKAGVEGFSNVLRHETLGTNIRILVNRPGTTRTEFHSRRHEYDPDKTASTYAGATPLAAEDIAVSILWQCLQPERISTVLVETLGTAQRSLYSADREYEKRNGLAECKEWAV